MTLIAHLLSFFLLSFPANAAIRTSRRSLNDLKRELKALQHEDRLQYPTLKPPPLIKPVFVNRPAATGRMNRHKKARLSRHKTRRKTRLASVFHKKRRRAHSRSVERPPSFDLPVTYNLKVKRWIHYYQTDGRHIFKTWLDRSYRYLPSIEDALRQKGLPQDLAYLCMIESGFSPHAVSSARAVGYWQFIKSTAHHYGLVTNSWLDERRDFVKSTRAAAEYLGDLYHQFRSWYLAAAAYNMGQTRLNQLIEKYHTKNFWVLSRKRDFPTETANYIPKLIAAMLISKAPGLYGFTELKPQKTYHYEYFYVPGGTRLSTLARYMGIPTRRLRKLNPALIKGVVPDFVDQHRIRIPVGFTAKVSQFLRLHM